jgi:hypothetical protein
MADVKIWIMVLANCCMYLVTHTWSHNVAGHPQGLRLSKAATLFIIVLEDCPASFARVGYDGMAERSSNKSCL